MKIQKLLLGALAVTAALLNTGCDLLNIDLAKPPTTKEKMMGVWEVTAATDENGNSIIQDIRFPVAAFHLADANSLNSTGGPMFMKVVYGKSRYTTIASQIDQVFNYASLSFTEGEWFIEGGYPDRFTLEIKLQGLPGQKSLTTILNALGIAQNYLDATVYHKFLDVKVSFEGLSDSLMVWEFDDVTTARYNTKDAYGNYVIWYGWNVNTFGRYKFTLTKRVKTLRQLIEGQQKSGVQATESLSR